MKRNSLDNQRIVFDYLSVHKSELHNFQIDKKLFLSCKGAHIWSLFRTRKGSSRCTRESQEKLKIVDEIVLVEKEKEEWAECTASIDSDITKYSTEAEGNRDFTLLTKANYFWKVNMEKEKSITAFIIAKGKLRMTYRL